jgi:hypothetical protein
MRRCLIVIALALTAGCRREAPPSEATDTNAPAALDPRMEEFLVKWLEAHGHKDVVVDAGGVGVGDNATRLQASLYGSTHHDNRGFVVEVEFTVRLLPSQRKITDFVAGIGDTEEQAIKDALLNFTLTTFHVVYKGFINADDPHMTIDSVVINGVSRDVIAGDIYMRGADSEKKLDLHAMRPQIQGALKNLPLILGPHWIKVVYSQINGKPTTVAVTLDNADHPALTEAVKNLNWPRRNGFYMVKQFILVK